MASNGGGRLAVVTGSNRGLGLGAARGLAAQGFRVVVSDLATAISDEAAASFTQLGQDALYHRLDVGDDASVAEFTGWLAADVGRVDVLVNNAGIQGDPGIIENPEDLEAASVLQADPDVALKTYNINTLGQLRLSQALIPPMREAGYGRVVNISSGAAQLADMWGSYACYRMSKTAVNALTRILAYELKGTGVLVNACDPGWTRTAMGGDAADLSIDEGADGIIWLAMLPDDGPSGGYFCARKPLDW